MDKYASILRSVVSLINAEALESGAAEVGALATDLASMARRVLGGGSELDSLRFLSAELVKDSASTGEPRFTIQTYECNAGGSLVIVLHERDGILEDVRDVRFNGCIIDDRLHDSDFLSVIDDRVVDENATFDALTVTSLGDGAYFRIDGRLRIADIRAGGGSDIAEISWTETRFESSDNLGTTTLADFQSYLSGWTGILFDSLVADVLLPDGSFVPMRYLNGDTAEIDATFTVTAPWSGDRPLFVDVELSYDNSYYDWGDPDTAPDFPFEDLDTPLTIVPYSNPSETVSFEPPPRDDDAPRQWKTGQIVVTAGDGSRVTLRPLANDPVVVEIRLGEAGEPVLREWSDGFQVRCPPNVAEGCGK